jgi:hypothetical protein
MKPVEKFGVLSLAVIVTAYLVLIYRFDSRDRLNADKLAQTLDALANHYGTPWVDRDDTPVESYAGYVKPDPSDNMLDIEGLSE